MGGLAGAIINVSDSTATVSSNPAGLIAFIGMTQRGDLNKPVIVGSELEYVRKFGDLLPVATSLFPLYCMRALRAGAKLLVVPIIHAGGTAATCSTSGSVLIATAKREGVYANSITLNITAPASRTTGFVDIFVTNTTGTISQTFRDVATTQTTTSIALLNVNSSYITFDSAVTSFTIGSYSFVGGVDTTAPLDADYAGSTSAKTGIHALDSSNGISFICAPDMADNVLDNTISSYCLMRGDCYPLLRTPIGLIGDAVLAYRTAVSPYSGTPVYTLGRMTTGGLTINHPFIMGAFLNISEVADVAAAYSVKGANDFAWISAANPKYSTISNATGVVVNFGSAGNKSDADAIVNAGIIPVVQLQDGSIRIYGDTTLNQLQNLLSNANIADLTLYLQLRAQQLANARLFTPDDVETWRGLFRDVSALCDFVKLNRGLVNYVYNGDQTAATINDVKVNTIADITAGKYKATLQIQPTPLLKYITINLNLTGTLVTTSVTL